MGYPRAGSETDDPLTPAQSRDHPYMMNVARLYRRQHLCVREVIRSLGRFGEIDRSCVYPLSSCIPLSPSIHQLSPPNWGGGHTARQVGGSVGRITKLGPLISITSSGYTHPAHVSIGGDRVVGAGERSAPRGSAAAIAASSSSGSSASRWERFFFFGLSPLNLSFLETTSGMMS
jgi:hypothetical protein